MRRQIPGDCTVVGESGIHQRQDVEQLQAAGIQAMLVGESLMAAPDIGHAVDLLLGKVRSGLNSISHPSVRRDADGPENPHRPCKASQNAWYICQGAGLIVRELA